MSRCSKRRGGAGPNRRGAFRLRLGLAYNPLTRLGNLGALWDFSKDVSVVLGNVDSVADQTGRGNTVSAPAAVNRPVYTAADADFAGQGTGTGDGVNDGLRRPAISMGAAFSPGTIIMVAKAVTSTAGDAYLSLGVNSTLLRENNALGNLETIQGTGVQVTTTRVLLRAHAIAYVCNGATIQQYIDGVPEGVAVAYVGATADGSSVGLFSRSDNPVLSPANVKIAFAAISMTALSASEMAAFGAYSRARFGTP